MTKKLKPSKTIIESTHRDELTKQLEDNIVEIHTYCGDLINSYTLKGRQILAMAIYRATCEYGLAIVTLMQSKQPFAKVSTALIRPIFEGLINIKYCLAGEGGATYLKELYSSYGNYLREQERLEEFFNKHDLEKIGGLYINKVRSRQTKAKKVQGAIRTQLNKYGPVTKEVNKKVNLYEKIQIIDHSPRARSIAESFEFQYRNIYPFLSSSIHLSADGGLQWFDIKKKQVIFNKNGETTDDINFSLATTLSILADITDVIEMELDFEEQRRKASSWASIAQKYFDK